MSKRSLLNTLFPMYLTRMSACISAVGRNSRCKKPSWISERTPMIRFTRAFVRHSFDPVERCTAALLSQYRVGSPMTTRMEWNRHASPSKVCDAYAIAVHSASAVDLGAWGCFVDFHAMVLPSNLASTLV